MLNDIKAINCKKELEEHKLWIDSKGKRGKLAQFISCNLEGEELSRLDLSNVDFSNSILNFTFIHGSELSNTKFNYSNLYRSDFSASKLINADFSNSFLYMADLSDTDLTGVIFSGADLYCTNFCGARNLPDLSWIKPGILIQLNSIVNDFHILKNDSYFNFVQDSYGVFLNNNPYQDYCGALLTDNPNLGTFDMLIGDKIIHNIPNWVKYSGFKRNIETV